MYVCVCVCMCVCVCVACSIHKETVLNTGDRAYKDLIFNCVKRRLMTASFLPIRSSDQDFSLSFISSLRSFGTTKFARKPVLFFLLIGTWSVLLVGIG